MATASINLPGAIWGSCKASAVAPGGYTSHRNCSDGWTVTPFVTTARFLDRHRWRTRKLVRELLVSIRVHFSPLPHSLSPFSCCKPHYLPSLPASCHRGQARTSIQCSQQHTKLTCWIRFHRGLTNDGCVLQEWMALQNARGHCQMSIT